MLIHDYNRNLYTLNISIAHGVKIVQWFIGGPYASREKDKSKRWSEGHHLVRIGRHMASLYKLIGEIGLPEAVYATPTRRRPDTNKDKKLAMEAHTTAFPKDFWLQFSQGEVLTGIFKHPDRSHIAYVCNQNAWAWQGVVMDVRQKKGAEMIVSRFNRKTAKWDPLGARKVVNFAIAPADAAVFRFETKPGTAIVTEAVAKWDPSTNFAEVAKISAVGIRKGLAPQIYSTPTARTAANEPKAIALPKGTQSLPDDFHLKVKQGEALIAVYQIDKKTNVVVFSNHNAAAWQGGVVDLGQTKDKPIIMSQFEHGKWNKLGPWKDVNFPLAPKGYKILKFEQIEPAKPTSKKQKPKPTVTRN
ncbi:MAG: hypothetical protein GY794_04620 [bacterium]|nr:hypothetical protein [bacterium]